MRYLVAVLLLGCSIPPIPNVPRPDTRRIGGMQFADSTVYNKTALVDSVTDRSYERNGTTVRVMHIYFPPKMPSGCGPPSIAIAHSHPMSNITCGGHSFDDAGVLFQARYAWFSMVFCSNGDVETLLQDGRRIRARWLP